MSPTTKRNPPARSKGKSDKHLAIPHDLNVQLVHAPSHLGTFPTRTNPATPYLIVYKEAWRWSAVSASCAVFFEASCSLETL